MKKILLSLFALSLTLSMAVVASAASDYVSEYDVVPARLIEPVEFDPSLVLVRGFTEEELTDLWASFRYDSALPKDVRDNIIRARFELATSGRAPSWVADEFAYNFWTITPEGEKEFFPRWSEVFPYWDFGPIVTLSSLNLAEQLYEISQEDTDTGSEDLMLRTTTRVMQWPNVTIPRNIRTILSPGWFSSGRFFEFSATALSVPRYNLNVYVNGGLSLANDNKGLREPTGGMVTTGWRVIFARGTYQPTAGTGTFVLDVR